MGKGDRRSKKGKIFAGSFGKKRPARQSKKNSAPKSTKDSTEEGKK